MYRVTGAVVGGAIHRIHTYWLTSYLANSIPFRILDTTWFHGTHGPKCSAVWCICCDAATARNMELPRFNGRLPKSMSGTLPKFGLNTEADGDAWLRFHPFLLVDRTLWLLKPRLGFGSQIFKCF